MAVPELVEQQGLRIAVEGCGHGVLHEIYASVAKACELKGWPGVDLLIIGGDFQVSLLANFTPPLSDLTGCSECPRPQGCLDARQILRHARLP
jgi:hypothetical protein